MFTSRSAPGSHSVRFFGAGRIQVLLQVPKGLGANLDELDDVQLQDLLDRAKDGL